MPVLPSTGYNTVEDVLNLLRVICDDSEIAAGDVITDTAPFTFTLLNGAYRRVQSELAAVGIETLTDYATMIGFPIMPVADPEGRMLINDEGTQIIYPSGVGNAFYLTPQLPTNLVRPLKLWERQTGTTNFTQPMILAPNEIFGMSQQSFFVDYEWTGDSIVTRGALQSQDIKMKYEKTLPALAAPTDPVPIRGVPNCAAYYAAMIFVASRGGAILQEFKATALDEIELYKARNSRMRQRKQTRRRPYSGRSRSQSPI